MYVLSCFWITVCLMLHMLYIYNTKHVGISFWLGLQYSMHFSQFLFYHHLLYLATVLYPSWHVTELFFPSLIPGNAVYNNCVSRTPQVLGIFYIVLVCILMWLENVHSEDRFLFNPVSILDIDTKIAKYIFLNIQVLWQSIPFVML
jgi:preprotein translocase subunit SecG